MGLAALVTLTLVISSCAGASKVSTPIAVASAATTSTAAATTNTTSAGTSSSSTTTSNNQSIFQPFPNDDGKVQSAPAKALNLPDLNANNVFFLPNLGGTVGNGQACSTCHIPQDGMTMHVTTIQNAFSASGGNDPLFRFNDTANNPNSPKNLGSQSDREQAYSLVLALGVARIGRTLPGTAEFIVAQQNTDTFGPLPCDPHNPDPTLVCNDPQQPGKKTLSLFRRPLVQTNMRFDSSVLWDGRADIRDIRAQVVGAAKTLLLTPTPTNGAADQAAHSQLGIFTDQVQDNRSSFPSSFAGNTSAQGALGGVTDLIDFAFDPAGPCIYTAPSGSLGPRALTFTLRPPDVSYFAPGGSLTSPTCTDVTPGGPNMTTFAAWATIPIDNTDITNISRRQIAHGEDIFNTRDLHIDLRDSDDELKQANELLANQLGLAADQNGVVTIHCTTCHATPNVGNHPEASFFVRIGSDSASILQTLADRSHANTDLFGNLDNFVTRTQSLPQYCLRNVNGPPLPGPGAVGAVDCTSFPGNPPNCDPNDTSHPCIPGDVVTADPGRAMTTGMWADIGKFKPPILRGLATRSPYFHGSAADSTVSIIEFYDVRFKIGLSEQEKEDLVRFVEAH